MTTINQVLEAVRSPLVTLATTFSVPLVIDNSPTVDFESVWIRAVTAVNSATVVTAPDRYRWSGSLEVSIYAPRATGDQQVLLYATLLQAQYRGLGGSSPIWRVESVSLVGTSVYGDGWSGRTVRISWTADLLA